MPHTLTDIEGSSLHMLALALRPDWKHNNPGALIKAAQDASGSIIEADDFPHAVRALVAYASAKGANRKRTPDLYPLSGRHWMSTRHKAGSSDDGLPPRELWCVEHDCGENACRGQHVRKPPPPGWRDQIPKDES